MDVVTVERWLYGVMSVDATIAAAVGTRIYGGQAPKGTAFPYVLYQFQGAERDLMILGGNRIWGGGTWLVRVVGKAENFSSLATVADRIDTLIHAQSGVVTGGEVFYCVRDGPFAMVETVDNIQHRHLGGLYEIKAK